MSQIMLVNNASGIFMWQSITAIFNNLRISKIFCIRRKLFDHAEWDVIIQTTSALGNEQVSGFKVLKS